MKQIFFFLFRLTIISDISLIALASLLLFVGFIHQQWVDKIWPEIRVPSANTEDTEEWTTLHPQ